MKTKLQKQLATIAPAIDIHTIWERDYDNKWEDPMNRDWTQGLEKKDWKCWQSEIRAALVLDGEMVSGSAYMGGTWEKAGDKPAVSNPEISGYEPQMTKEALEDLAKLLPAKHPAKKQITNAVQHVRIMMRKAYEEQMQPA